MNTVSFARVALPAAAAAALAPGRAIGSRAPIGRTQPVRATQASLDPGRLYSSRALAVDPRDPVRVVALFADLRNRRCGLMRSTDGGSSWTLLDGSPALPPPVGRQPT